MNIIHQIWLGGRPLPEYALANLQTMRRLYPDCLHKLWTDENLPKLRYPELFASARHNAVLASDLLRYEVLYQFGGIYLDTDMEPVKPLPDAAWRADFLICQQTPETYGTAILGSHPGHAFWPLALEAAPRSIADPANGDCVCWQTGPTFITRLLKDNEIPVSCLPTESCYPYRWDEKPGEYPDAYFIHRWKNGGFSQE